MNGTAEVSQVEVQKKKKFGTFMGVFIPSILTILGVIMYLRMGYVVGAVGPIGTIVIVTISSLITFLTALSISATSTNMTVKTGGAYYMISRSFGAEAGAAIGIPLFLAQAVGISFYIAGFSESLSPLLPSVPSQVIGLASLLVLTLLANFSPSLALKTQIGIFIIISLSILSLVMGKPLPVEVANEVAVLNDVPSFWTIFALFFPAVTGILSGVSMSGDLENPGRSIPLGTIASVIVGYLIYILVPLTLWYLVPREILLTDNTVISKVALFPSIIFLGIWGATLSSALGSLMAAPRTLQALANDKILPRFLGRGVGDLNNPVMATILSCMIAAVGIWAGTLDVIAPVLTMFFLTSYGILNLISGVESLIGNPSWRPKFKVHWALSFAGAASCFSVMIFINAAASYAALIFCGLVYYFAKGLNINPHWSDIRRGLLLHIVRDYIYQLDNYQVTGRTWRPNLLVLSGAPTSRWYLIEFADALSHGKGFLTVCTILTSAKATLQKAKSLENSIRSFLLKKEVPALTKVKVAENKFLGLKGMIDDYGLGAISPNTVVFGEDEEEETLVEFSELVKLIFNANKNVLILRHPERFDSELLNNKKEAKFIDIWWGRISANSNLMLAFSYMLLTSPEWAGATLRVRSLVKDEDERRGIMANLQELLTHSRIRAQVDVFVKKEGFDNLEQIAKYSKDSDLVFIGMKRPDDQYFDPATETLVDEEESKEHSYASYYSTLLSRTEKFPMVVFALAGEQINFEEIFKEG